MPLPTIDDTIRAAVRGRTALGAQWINVLHFRKTPVTTFPAAIGILDPKLLALYATVLSGTTPEPWKALAPIGASVQDIVYTPLDNSSASTTISHVVAGTAPGDALPASVACVVTLRTAKRGRSYRGRCYWGPAAESINQSDGTLGPNATFINTQWTSFLATLVATGVSLVVASYKHSTAEDVTSITVDSTWDTQRRRLR